MKQQWEKVKLLLAFGRFYFLKKKEMFIFIWMFLQGSSESVRRREREREVPLNSKSEALLRAAEKLGSSIIAEKRL